MSIKEAMDTLKKAFKDDPSYAHSWHCNIAMACYDSIYADSNHDDVLTHEEAHKIGNEAASRFMKLAFNVVTSNDMLSK